MGDDVFQANNMPSARTPRGHQGPAGFLMLVSGLDKVTAEYSCYVKSFNVPHCIHLPPKKTVLFLFNCFNSSFLYCYTTELMETWLFVKISAIINL